MDSAVAFFSSLQSPFVFALGVLAARYMPLPATYQPWLILRAAGEGLARRVLRPSAPASQQRLAGWLSLLVLLAPLVLMLWLIRQVSAWPEFFDAVLLYLCLDVTFLQGPLKQVQASLNQGQLSLAKQQLQPWVFRKTHTLSQAGLLKAAFDAAITRFAGQWLTVLLAFVLIGPLAALLARAVIELRYSWNTHQPRYRDFGQPARLLQNFISAFPMLTMGCYLAFSSSWQTARGYFQQAEEGKMSLVLSWLLASWAVCINRQTGGPVLYDHEKVRRPRFGPAIQPAVEDINGVVRSLSQLFWLLWVLFLLFSFVPELWHLALLDNR